MEKDIYIATRGIIDETGFRTLTFERVAKKAATSKPVIYRRWKTPFGLALAALQDKIRRDNHGKVDEIVLTGQSLREDLFQVLHRFLVSVDVIGKSFFREILAEPNCYNDSLAKIINGNSSVDINAINRILKRALKRGEHVKKNLPEAIKLLPFDWLRYRVFVQESIDEKALELLVDDIILPI
ncbi:TetR family transcriptional regulator, partial [Oenococcus oeni]|uniref:TetR/AcrR family transcriptional regulator n=1 Tax=Oenococcus oeni TaxID=1247 RepID=UPI0008F7EC96